MIPNNRQQGALGLTYDGVDLTETFIIVDIDIPPLPTMKATTYDLAQRAGSYFANQQVGTRTITLKLRLNAETRDPMGIAKAVRDYMPLLNKPTPRKLQLNETAYMWAIIQGTPKLTDTAYYGDVELQFVCFDPYIYGTAHTVSLSDNTAKSVTVEGDYPAQPIFTLTTSSATVTVANTTTGEYVAIPDLTSGQTLTVDMAKHVCTVGGNYAPVELASTYFEIDGTQSVKVTGAAGTLTYEERYL